jgi:hypothetical protein
MAKEFVVGHGDLHTMQGNEKIVAPLIERFNMHWPTISLGLAFSG